MPLVAGLLYVILFSNCAPEVTATNPMANCAPEVTATNPMANCAPEVTAANPMANCAPEFTAAMVIPNIHLHHTGMEPPNIMVYDYETLVHYTDNFSESNYIGNFQFGKLHRAKRKNYRGMKHFLVKTWNDSEIYNCRPEDNLFRLMKELILLRHETVINHPGMVKLFAYVIERERLCVAYEFNPFDSLFNLIPKDGFTWLHRIKSALVLASLLKFLHGIKYSPYKPFIVHNLDAAHVLLDEDYNPKLCDFGLLTGGFFPEKRVAARCLGYTDTNSYNADNSSTKVDVFAFGVILLSLISKRVHSEEDRPYIYDWALREAEAFESDRGMKNIEFSLVHQSLASECEFCFGDGVKLTKLALDCVNGVESERPTMKQVYRVLLKLETVKQHADFLGANKELSPTKNV